MKEILKRGATSNILRVFLQDSTSTTGAGKTGLTSGSAGLTIATITDNETSATAYSGGNVEAVGTLGVYSAPTAGKCRFSELSSSNFPGVYEIQIADARFSIANSTQLLICIQATGVAPVFVEYQIVAVDLMDAVRLGLTALPSIAQGNAGALITSGSGTAQLSVSSGAVTTGAVTSGIVAADVWNALLATYTGTNTFGGRIVRTLSTSLTNEVTIGSSNHIASSVHAFQANVITNAAFAASAIAADALATDATNEIADALLNRNVAGGSSTGRLVKEALYVLRNKSEISGTTLNVYDATDTLSWTATVSSSASANPVTGIDPP
jgi:hypothetical protein